MSNIPQSNTEWIPLQVKVFSRWVSSHLVDGHADVQVNDITKDLSNGVALVELAKILIGKDTPRHWVHEPKRTIDMVQNCDLSIEMFEKDGVHLVGISGKDINDNREKLILGYIWTLILHYSIGKSVSDADNSKTNTSVKTTEKNSKDELMKWAIDRTSNYPNIKDFHPYDLSMCALLDSYVPDKINYYHLDPNDSTHNAKLAADVMHEIGVPVYVYPEDCDSQHNVIDEKVLLTQLSTAKVNLEKLPPPLTRIQEMNVESVVTDFNQSTTIAEKFEVESGEIIPNPISIENTNVENAVADFNAGDGFNEEIIQEGLAADDAADRINSNGDSVPVTDSVNVESVVSDFNQSTVVNEEVVVERGEVIPDPAFVEDTNVENAVADFNAGNGFNEEVIQEGLAADDAADKINSKGDSIPTGPEFEPLVAPVIDRSNVVIDNYLKFPAQLNPADADTTTDSTSDSDVDLTSKPRNVGVNFIPGKVEGDNSQYAGHKFGLILNLNESDYNNGHMMNPDQNQLLFGEEISLALTLEKTQNPYLNPAGLLLDVAEPNIVNNVNQQFVFGEHEWDTVIDSCARKGMVWDVCDEHRLDPPAGTPFYLFPFHGRHNQHFIYKDEMIYAQQNGMVVTYVGGDEPLVMMPPDPVLKARQTFKIQLL